jgi:hypothetical protein
LIGSVTKADWVGEENGEAQSLLDLSFDPVGWREGYAPEIWGWTVERESYDKTRFGRFISGGRRVVGRSFRTSTPRGHRFDADDPASFCLVGRRVSKSDYIPGAHGSDGEPDGTSMGVDDNRFALGDPFSFQKEETSDDADFEINALTPAAIANGGTSRVPGFVHFGPFKKSMIVKRTYFLECKRLYCEIQHFLYVTI